jgi:hypothetical protein
MQLRSAIVAGRSRAARFPVVTDPSPSRRTKSAQLWFVVIPVCVMPVHGQARVIMARPARDRLRPQPRFPEGPPQVHPRYICALTSQYPACEKGRPGECKPVRWRPYAGPGTRERRTPGSGRVAPTPRRHGPD